MENELIVTVLQMISEKKIVLSEMSAYQTLSQLMSIVTTESLLNSKTFDSILKQFIMLSERKTIAFNELALQTIIIEHVLLQCTKRNLLQTVSLGKASAAAPTTSTAPTTVLVEDHLGQIVTETLLKGVTLSSSLLLPEQEEIHSMDKFDNENEVIAYLQILSKYIKRTQKLVKRSQEIEQHIKIEQNVIENFLAMIIEFSKQVFKETSIGYKESIEAELWTTIQMFIEYLFNIGCDKGFFFKKLKEIGCEENAMPSNECDTDIRHAVLTSVIDKNVSENVNSLRIYARLLLFAPMINSLERRKTNKS